ncbi:hypothetical protein B0I35DRAFT_481913 [Stachybotrys elegans]|uniref:Uncharacterized protein n=1 Tax=Stachybotrys elegans TaxID=80388 RepID=A0A8K0WNK0_9HYPO|nr:hypothetical protein B0I35DRAFT_481913 [Stachybotrys elegans]
MPLSHHKSLEIPRGQSKKPIEEMKDAVEATGGIMGGSLDYLIANANYVPQFDAYDPMGILYETSHFAVHARF